MSEWSFGCYHFRSRSENRLRHLHYLGRMMNHLKFLQARIQLPVCSSSGTSSYITMRLDHLALLTKDWLAFRFSSIVQMIAWTIKKRCRVIQSHRVESSLIFCKKNTFYYLLSIWGRRVLNISYSFHNISQTNSRQTWCYDSVQR